MKSCFRAAVAAICLLVAGRISAAALPVPFQVLTFQAASELAAKERKHVFIDFYTTWCEPCKKLDAQTFSDARVAQLIGEHAIAIKLDAEKEGRELAKLYKVAAYPTLLLVKSDGTEVDRILGFREPSPFIADFKKLVTLAAAGKTGLDEARNQVTRQARSVDESDEPEEAQPHFDLARKLIIAGDHKEALRELLWCWDEGKKDPDFARSRSTRVATELGRLARSYPPAIAAMKIRRDQARERVLANKGGTVAVQDLIQLNRELKMDDDTVAVFDVMPEGDRRKVTISIYLFDVFVEKQRYADATLFNMVETTIMSLERAKAQLKGGAVGPSLQFVAKSIAKRVEALAGAGLVDQARDLGERLLAIDDSAETKALLQQHLVRAGKPELLGVAIHAP